MDAYIFNSFFEILLSQLPLSVFAPLRPQEKCTRDHQLLNVSCHSYTLFIAHVFLDFKIAPCVVLYDY